MNDRKRAWQMLHTEIRRRTDPDPASSDAYNINFGHLLKDAENLDHVIIELAGFGATFATMHRSEESARELADLLGARVMQEPDEVDEDEE